MHCNLPYRRALLFALLYCALWRCLSLNGFAQESPLHVVPPVAPVRPVVDDYFGTRVSDPYRYMENLKDAEVQGWMRTQNDYTRETLARISGRRDLLARIQQLDWSVPAHVRAVQRLPNGRYFYLKSSSKEAVFKLYMRATLQGAERLLVDPERLREAGAPPKAINYFSPSNDGRYVVYGISSAGSEKAVLHVLDTAALRDIGETIDLVQFGDPIGWLPDGRSFTYNRLRELPPEAAEEEKEIKTRAYLHVIGTDPARDVAVFGYGVSPLVQVAPEDISFVAIYPGVSTGFGIIAPGSLNEIKLYAAPIDSLAKPNVLWRKICDVDDAVVSMASRGDDLWLLTHKEASRFKVIHTHVSHPDLRHADVVVAASDVVLNGIEAAQDALYITARAGATGRLLRVGYEAGATPETLTLPFEGWVELYPADPRLAGVALSLSGWTKAERIYEYDPGVKRMVDTALRIAGPFDDPIDLESEEVKVMARDGTAVPLSIVHKRGFKRDGSNPTLLIGYGAYGLSIDPFFDPIHLAWLERGGVLAFAHVRGGGEHGNDWHMAGQKLTKPNTWRDFIDCAEYLIKEKYTKSQYLAGQGESAGGILIGRAITERPDLFGAAVIEVGFVDGLRGETEESGPGDIPEWGTVKDPDGFRGLYEMSPYAHVKDETPYPAVLLTTGTQDPRVAPWEPAKMTARLQAATTSRKPVLLRVDHEAGHGIGSTRIQAEQQVADEWSFLFWQFGLAEFQPSERNVQ